MRVFLDTNVLVSAFATRGLCADVLRTVLSEYELVTSEVILAELERVLSEKLCLPRSHVNEIVELLKQQVVVSAPATTPSLDLRDEDDLLVIASAIAAQAELFVTGDSELLSLDTDNLSFQIVSPRQFWSLLAAKKTAREGSPTR